MSKIRLDKYLVDKNFFKSRNKAQIEIRAGNVYVDSTQCKKKSVKVDENNRIEIKDRFLKYVGRAALKLKKFIKGNNIDVANKVVLDVGSSTGGFVEVLLEEGASSIIAVDVGKNQLDEKLKKNNSVEVFENTDIRKFIKKRKEINFDIITVDVSFISLKKIVGILKDRAEKYIFLFKPQFETKKNKKGIVKNLELHVKLLKKFVDFLEKKGFNIKKIERSKIIGEKGNIEYFVFCSNRFIDNFDKEKIKEKVF